jgi:hypothetical protein
MKLNNRQQSFLNFYITKAITTGNGDMASGRNLKSHEFKPSLSEQESGAIWEKPMIPQDLNAEFSFMPVINGEGKEFLGLFLKGKSNLLPIALVAPDCAPELLNDIMVSSAQYKDATILSEVSKSVQDICLAYDLPIKKQLLANSNEALEMAMNEAIEKRVKAKTKHFESTIDSIEAHAELKMAKVFANKLAELATIAVIPDSLERKLKMESIMPEIKRILEITTK